MERSGRKNLTQGVGQLTKARKINYIQGYAYLEDANNIKITSQNNQIETVHADNIIIATGSTPRPIKGLDFSSRVMDSTSALELNDIPKKLLIIGAGYIGLEIGTIYSRLGSEVTVAEMMSEILPLADEDIALEYKKEGKKIFKDFMVNTLAEAKEENDGVSAVFKDFRDQNKIIGREKFDKILVTIGRIPLSNNLGLENTKVEIDDKGFIKINLQRQTNENSIYAIGDVAGGPLLAHKATHEGRIAAEAISGRKVAFEPNAIPAVEYTDPEIAWCGLTEKEAREKNIEIKVAKFPWAASGRALTMGRKDGVHKIDY